MASIHSTHTNILNAFTYPTLDPIDNEPTYESLKLLHEQLGENAARVPTTYGGGLYGHLGLVTKPNVYFTLAGVHFNVPQDPGPYDIRIPLRAAAGERARLEKEHDKRKQEYDLCLAVSNVLKNQIVDAIKGPYLRELRDRRFGYLNSTPLDMLDHLFDRYGNLTAIDVQECKTQFN